MQKFYIGKSMWPTFRPGDLLEVAPLHRFPRSGDVVMFRQGDSETDDCPVVHRVRAMTAKGFVTQGDNSPYPDSQCVSLDQIVGIVTHVHRGGKFLHVHGGRYGLWTLRRLVAARAIRRILRLSLHTMYGQMRDSGILARIWQPQVSLLRINSPDGTLIKYLWRGRTIARWWPRQNKFECRKPWDLVIKNNSSSPDKGTESGGRVV
jgi:signal peptidase I